MTDSPFHGVIPPVVIPLTEKKQLDLEAFERSINRMIDAGVDGLFFLGSSGEVAFLTDAQRYHVLHLEQSYANCSYHAKDRSGNTEEVLITNYAPPLPQEE